MNSASSLLRSISVVFGLLGSLPAHVYAAPGELAMARAKIVAIRGNSITIQNDSGARRTLDLKRTNGLKIGLQTGWCEEDCRVLNIWTEYPVRRINPVRP
jgi:hypothetical protein